MPLCPYYHTMPTPCAGCSYGDDEMERTGNFFVDKANEIADLKQQITALQADNARLRLRMQTAINWLEGVDDASARDAKKLLHDGLTPLSADSRGK